MSLQVLSRLVGPVSVGAASLIIVSQTVHLGLGLALGSQSANSPVHSLKYGLALFAMYALLLALTGLYLRQANAAGKLGLAGYLIAFLGTLLIAGDWWFESFIAPQIAAVAPEVMSGAILARWPSVRPRRLGSLQSAGRSSVSPRFAPTYSRAQRQACSFSAGWSEFSRGARRTRYRSPSRLAGSGFR